LATAAVHRMADYLGRVAPAQALLAAAAVIQIAAAAAIQMADYVGRAAPLQALYRPLQFGGRFFFVLWSCAMPVVHAVP